MSARVAPYDIAAVEFLIGGIAIKDGLVSAEIAPEGPAFADEIGADGLVCRYATNERRHTMTVVLKGSSEENAKLSALHGADVSATNGLGIVPMFLRDGNGTSIISTDAAWITQLATKSFGASAGDCTWNIRCVLASPLNAVIGGN
jgi:hypothetical protein